MLDEKINQYVCADCIGASLANHRALVAQYKPPKLLAGEVTYEVDLEGDETSVPWDLEELASIDGFAVSEEV